MMKPTQTISQRSSTINLPQSAIIQAVVGHHLTALPSASTQLRTMVNNHHLIMEFPSMNHQLAIHHQLQSGTINHHT